MNPVKTKLPPDVVAILAACTIIGNVLTLSKQPDRKTYLRVDKALKGHAANGTARRAITYCRSNRVN